MRALAFDKNKNAWFMLFVLFFFFLLRFPSLFEPYWYGDEGVYQTLGVAIRHDRLLYRDIWDNKPPLIYLLYSLFNSDQFATRAASLIFGLLSVLVFFFLAKKLFTKPKIYNFSTIIFALLFGLPVIEGNIANAENFMILPILVAALLITNVKKQMSKIKLFSAGLMLGLAFLFKVVAIFDFLAFLLFLIFIIFPINQSIKVVILSKAKDLLRFFGFQPQNGKKHTTSTYKKVPEVFLLLLGFFIPIAITTLFFTFKGAFGNFLQATFMQNVGYVSYGNKFLIPNGFLFLKTILLAIFILYIFKVRKMLSLTTIFILIWFAFSLFNAFFAKRPFSHYLLVLMPSFSLIVALIFWDKKYQKIITLFLLLAMTLILSNFHFFSKSISYYQNFISFIANKKSTIQYEAFFDKKTPIDYEIALFLKPKVNKNDTIFIWGNNAQVYKLTGTLPPGKYVVAYHITGYKDGILNTENAINKVRPKFIVIMPDQQNIPFVISRYFPRIKIGSVLIYERTL